MAGSVGCSDRGERVWAGESMSGGQMATTTDEPEIVGKYVVMRNPEVHTRGIVTALRRQAKEIAAQLLVMDKANWNWHWMDKYNINAGYHYVVVSLVDYRLMGYEIKNEFGVESP